MVAFRKQDRENIWDFKSLEEKDIGHYFLFVYKYNVTAQKTHFYQK